jgi:hypothetical protein
MIPYERNGETGLPLSSCDHSNRNACIKKPNYYLSSAKQATMPEKKKPFPLWE